MLKFILSILLLAACNGTPPAPVPVEPDPTYSTGLIKPDNRDFGVVHFIPKGLKGDMPANYSWEDQGFATPVRNQGNCGSCWAFGSTQGIEMGYKIFAHRDIDFSEQHLVGNLFSGCGGGYFAGDFQVKTGQLAEEQCPYSASNHRCSVSPSLPVAGKGVSQGIIGQPGRRASVEEVQNGILTYGALPVTVAAGGGFMSYKSGLSQGCPSGSTNHIVALTGWKTGPDGLVYFKIKNSWGVKWGDNGYGYFRLGCYNLGEEVAFLAVEAIPCPPPAVRLPAEFILNHGDDVVIAVKNIAGVTYEWFLQGKKIGDGPLLELHVDQSDVLTMKAHNKCGDAEIKTKLTVI